MNFIVTNSCSVQTGGGGGWGVGGVKQYENFVDVINGQALSGMVAGR